jgi:hypothetical protein
VGSCGGAPAAARPLIVAARPAPGKAATRRREVGQRPAPSAVVLTESVTPSRAWTLGPSSWSLSRPTGRRHPRVARTAPPRRPARTRRGGREGRPPATSTRSSTTVPRTVAPSRSGSRPCGRRSRPVGSECTEDLAVDLPRPGRLGDVAGPAGCTPRRRAASTRSAQREPWGFRAVRARSRDSAPWVRLVRHGGTPAFPARLGREGLLGAPARRLRRSTRWRRRFLVRSVRTSQALVARTSGPTP